MKKDTAYLIIIVLSALVLIMRFCGSRHQSGQLVEKIDTLTVVVHDTVAIIRPEPAKVIILPQTVRRLPVYAPPLTSADTPAAAIDSADVIVPLETKIYQDSSYRAVITGAWVTLDTMQVYPRHEITTIRHPVHRPKRWGIGIGAGYGMTPRGLQPWAGVTLTYTIWHF